MTTHADLLEWFHGLHYHIDSNDAFAPLREVVTDRRPSFRLFEMRDERLRDLMLSAIDSYQTNTLNIPHITDDTTAETKRIAGELSERGHAGLSAVAPEKVNEMMAFFRSEPVASSKDAETGEFVTIDQARSNQNFAGYPVERIFQCPHFMELANDPGVLAAVERYLGATPTILVPAVWWSFANRDEAKGAQRYHFDIDDYKFCKLFIYLTDVDEDSGPHTYLERTHIWSVIDDCYTASSLSERDFYTWYFPQIRKSDDEVNRFIGIPPTTLTGPAGSRFLVDTQGIHKGSLPRIRDRLLCQVTYGVTPALQLQLNPIPVPVDNSGPIPAWTVAEMPYAYINRAFLVPGTRNREAAAKEDRMVARDGGNTPPASPPSKPCRKKEKQTMTKHVKKMDRPQTILLSGQEEWESDVTRDYVVDAIFEDDYLRELFKKEVLSRPMASNVKRLEDMIGLMKAVLRDSAGFGNATLSPKFTQGLHEVAKFEEQMIKSLNIYKHESKPNPDAIYWPSVLGKDKNDFFKTIPYIEGKKFISKDTPIGSAGSCFAVQIAKNLLSRGFNYVHTEYSGDLETGVFTAETDPKKPEIRFSANWGILFNTPSFRQIAEKAFGERDLPRIVIPRYGFYLDPFREGVIFPTIEAYEADYEKHTRASREALMKCEYFVITLGLNECWELVADGSVLSRNPRQSEMIGLVRHRTLTVKENVDSIQRFFDIVRVHNPNFKLLISVSPIPFLATGRADKYHVITANTHSKSVLRVAAQELTERNPDMHYFPSYEMITVCSRNAWNEDMRHVSDEGVGRVMELFDAMFLADPKTGAEAEAKKSAGKSTGKSAEKIAGKSAEEDDPKVEPVAAEVAEAASA